MKKTRAFQCVFTTSFILFLFIEYRNCDQAKLTSFSNQKSVPLALSLLRAKRVSTDASKASKIANQCQHFQFACRNSGECIAIYNVCDGIPQCPDGSDEAADLNCPDTSSLSMFMPDKVNSASALPTGSAASVSSSSSTNKLNQNDSMATVHTLFDHQPHALPSNNFPFQYPKMPDLVQMESLLQQQAQQQAQFNNPYSSTAFQPNVVSRFDWPTSSFNQPNSNLLGNNNNYPYMMSGLTDTQSQPWSNFGKSISLPSDSKPTLDRNVLMSNFWPVQSNAVSDAFEQRRRFLQNLSQQNYLQQIKSQTGSSTFTTLNPLVNASKALQADQEENNRLLFRSSSNSTNLKGTKLNENEKTKVDSIVEQHSLDNNLKSNALLSNSSLKESKTIEHKHSSSTIKDLIKSMNVDLNLVSYDFSDPSNRKRQQMLEDQEKEKESNSAIIALMIGLVVTSLLLFAVGYRMRSIHRRLMRGRAFNLSGDSDYLINGLYV